MNTQLAQIIKYTPVSEFKVSLRKLVNFEENQFTFQPMDLDSVFMCELLNEYEKKDDENLKAWVKTEKYLLSKNEIDIEHFFERQYLMLMKELDKDIYFQLNEQLFKFRVRLNGEFSIIFRLKQFEAFEQLLKKQIQHLSPRMTISLRKQIQNRKTLSNRPSSLGKMFLRAFSKNNIEIESQQQQEPLFTFKNINGLDCYQLNEFDQFSKQEQNIILNVSSSHNKLVDDSDEDEELEQFQLDSIKIKQNEIKNHKIMQRQQYLEYIYGNTKKLESVIMSSIPFNTIQEIESENMISITTLQRPLLNSQSAESVLIYGNKLPNKNFIPKERDLWKIAKQLLKQKYKLFSSEHFLKAQTPLRKHKIALMKKNLMKIYNNDIC
ncbi:unnamed protein product [Paramecium pentaurelia]|uniref:Uncharacterized protein n=1 Tax=Paramecium pentaurelia TaxID=43138 RepID=A0A8S1T4P9_9CILI|nr:unnamed protein product [Paramecium pentaurelia]